MIVKPIKSEKETYWYKHFIEELFNVRKIDGKYYRVVDIITDNKETREQFVKAVFYMGEVNCTTRLVIDDCIVISEKDILTK